MPIALWIAALSLFSAAAALGVIAWRMARGAHVRESARVELLKRLAFPDGSAAAASGPSISNWTPSFLSEGAEDDEEQEPMAVADTVEQTSPTFAERASAVTTTVPRWWISFVAVGAVIAAVVGAVSAKLVSKDDSIAAGSASRATAAPTIPIELIALQSRFDNGTTFDVNGLVRNPVDGSELSQLMAVIDLFGADGRLLTSGTAGLERPTLEAGQTSAFALAFQRVSGTVASYKVRFCLPSGDPIPHIDHRGSQPAAKPPVS